jgi:hypothetical protein
LNTAIFPPDNIIYGDLATWSGDSWFLYINLDEGEVIHEPPEWEEGIEVIKRSKEYDIMVLPYNHKIIGIAEVYTIFC